MHGVRKRIWIGLVVLLSLAGSCFMNYEVPILMYHRVGPATDEPGLSVSLQNFERQMEFLKIHRYRVIPLEEAVSALRQGKRLPLKTVVITFDDGTIDNIQNAFPVLKKMGFPATVFMITENINRPGWLSEEDLRLMDQDGMTVGSHTVSHAFLPHLTDEVQLRAEIEGSKSRLEQVLGRPVTLFSYPAGGFTLRAQQLVQEAGYEGAVTTNHGRKKADVFAMRRIKIKDSNGSLFHFWIKASGLYHLGKKRIAVE